MAGSTNLEFADSGDGFTAEMIRRELQALQYGWDEAYDISVTGDGLWTAVRRDGKGKVEADSASELHIAIFQDYDSLPVPRDLPGAQQ